MIRVRRSYGDGEFGPPKSRRSSRAVPMADRVAAELDAPLPAQRASRATTTSSSATRDSAASTTPRSCASGSRRSLPSAGLRPVRFHDLRHTFGTQMAAAGAPLRAIQEWMGHSDYRTTSIYADYAPDPSGARATPRTPSAGSRAA